MGSTITGKKIKQSQRFLEDGTRIPVTVVGVDGNIENLKPGDVVQVRGISKGKGFAGVVKRHHFRGGPRTHGQSDRERAPGSIGQTTTPGRVYKGKRMAGRMGHKHVTIKNLRVVSVAHETVTVKGLVPGARKSQVMIRKMGEDTKFVPLFEGENEKTATTETQKTSETQKVSVSEEFSDSVVAREEGKDAS